MPDLIDELQKKKQTLVHNLRVTFNKYIKTEVEMLEQLGIDDEGDLIMTDIYHKKREQCAKLITAYTEIQDRIKDIDREIEIRKKGANDDGRSEEDA